MDHGIQCTNTLLHYSYEVSYSLCQCQHQTNKLRGKKNVMRKIDNKIN